MLMKYTEKERNQYCSHLAISADFCDLTSEFLNSDWSAGPPMRV